MQTTYTNDMTAGRAGVLVGDNHSIRTKNNPVDEIPFGVAVAKVSADDNGIQLFNHPTDDIIGVSVLTEGVTDTSYAADSAVPMCHQGTILVPVDQTVVAGDSVFVRHSATLNVQTVTWDGDFVNLNSIAFSVNGDALTATVFAVDHDTTIAALAAKIQDHADVLTAVAAGRVITVTSVNSEALTMTSTVTLGASQASETVATTVEGVAGNQGYFRKDSDSNKATQITDAYFVKGASSGGFAELSLLML